MEFFVVAGFLGVFIALMIFGLSRPGARRSSRGPGPGAAGAFHDMLIEDRRKAIEIIVEERAGYTDPETADDRPDGDKPKIAAKIPITSQSRGRE